MQDRVNKILKQIAIEHKLPYTQVKKMWECQFKELKKTIEEGPIKQEDNTFKFPVIRLPSWGKYFVTELKQKRYTKKYENK